MGIKRFKKEFNIEHLVHKIDNKICIGSPLCSELISIHPKGEITKSPIITPKRHKVGELYYSLITTDKERLLEIINTPENFTNLKSVYRETERGKIVTEFCEEYGWPNVTTTGELMYDNTHFKTREAALEHAIRNTRCELKFFSRDLGNTFIKLIKKIRDILSVLVKLIRQGGWYGNL